MKVPCGPVQLLKETWRARLQRGYRATIADNLVHVNHFSPRSLRLALERAGFDGRHRGDRRAGVSARRRPRSAAVRLALYNLGRSVPAACTRRSRCTCRRSPSDRRARADA